MDERLPPELCVKVLSLLDYRQLAAASLVCRNWKELSSESDLWQQLFLQRWGVDQASSVCKSGFKSWKYAYEIQDRCERIGFGNSLMPHCKTIINMCLIKAAKCTLVLVTARGEKIIREGSHYYLTRKGAILRYLGSCKNGFEGGSDPNSGAPKMASCLDRLLFFVGDLDHAMRTKRNKTTG